MRSGSRCPAFYGEIPPMRWGILNDDGGYFYCITYTRERTEYLAGQIASCIQKGIWMKSHLAFMKERSYFPNGRYGWTLLIAYGSSDHTGKPVKILGSFQTNMDEKAGKNYSDEEKDALLTVYRLAD